MHRHRLPPRRPQVAQLRMLHHSHRNLPQLLLRNIHLAHLIDKLIDIIDVKYLRIEQKHNILKLRGQYLGLMSHEQDQASSIYRLPTLVQVYLEYSIKQLLLQSRTKQCHKPTHREHLQHHILTLQVKLNLRSVNLHQLR